MKIRSWRLTDCYGLAFLQAVAATMLLQCIYFWARARFGFTDLASLLLAALAGGAYVLGSVVGGRQADRLGNRRSMLCSHVGMVLAIVGLLGAPRSWGVFPLLMLYSGLQGFFWPATEAILFHSASRRLALPDRLSLFNVTWALGNVVAMLTGGWLFARHPAGVLVVPACIHLLQLGWNLACQDGTDRAPGMVDLGHAGTGLGRASKRRFMHMAWLGNSMAYFLQTAMGALAPYLGGRMGLSERDMLWLISLLFLSRTLMFAVCWKWTAWHYRLAWSQWAFWLAPLCMAVAFATSAPLVVAVAFVGFGACHGLTYSTSLYYSIDYGESKAEHGGFHEAVLGLGTVLGPLAGSAGALLAGGTVGAPWAVVLAALAIGAVGQRLILRP